MEVLEPEKRIVAADGIHSQLNNMWSCELNTGHEIHAL